MIHRFERLNYRQVDSLRRDKTAIFIPISPLEEHGPHLPVGVDAFNAEYFAFSTAEKLQTLKPEWDIVIHPLLPVGTQVFKFIGSINLRQRVVRDLVSGVGSAFAIYGFKYIIVFSFHGGPRHIVALEEACSRVSKKYDARMISITGAIAEKFLSGGFIADFEKEMGIEFTDQEKRLLSEDIHAGWWETSMMLKIQPECVQAGYKGLEPMLVPYHQLGRKSSWSKGKGLGYFGAPHKASVEFSEASIRILDRIGLDIICRHLDGDDVSKEVTSRFYGMYIFRTEFKRILGLAVIIILLIMAFLIFGRFGW
ncbi:MAG: hypothetical protein CO189_08600 [candidate division Zixibacteria bacterium CG_4_9_14_3_um_filter_46_8]|nr:MAG: hypothetical protein CO189_08600 [candidate division Zixibacteria bacterium CG_4_9_14_3_um_filter_46_8]